MKAFKFKFVLFLLVFASSCQSNAQTEEQKIKTGSMMKEGLQVATFGGGCFWCTEAIFQMIEGVDTVVSGYSDGNTLNPTYEDICTGATGHAEVIQIAFDPKKVTYIQLLKVFFETHDPTTLNQQGADRGTQYRSIILTEGVEQKEQALSIIAELEKNNIYTSKIVTEVKALDVFYPAEKYHQDYYNQNTNQGYCRAVITPKVEKFEKTFSELIKKD